MIILQILFSFVLVPLVVLYALSLAVTINHPAYKYGFFALALLIGLLFGFVFSTALGGLIVAILAATLGRYVNKKRVSYESQQAAGSGKILHIAIKDESVSFSLTFPLSTLKLVKLLPNRVLNQKLKINKLNLNMNVKETIDLFLKEAAGTTIDIKDKSSKVLIRVI